MNFHLMIGLTRVRLALVIAGIAWLGGLEVPALYRLGIVAAIGVAFVLEATVDEQQVKSATQPATHHSTA